MSGTSRRPPPAPGSDGGSSWQEGFRGRWPRPDGAAEAGTTPWAVPWTPGRRGFPWLGILLVLLGVALIARQIEPRIDFGSLVLLALGVAFALSWLMAGVRWAMLPAFVLLALACARLLEDVGVLVGDGWSALAIGLALLAAGLLGRRDRRYGWALWIGALLTIVGLASASDRIPGIPGLSAVWPLIIIGAGVFLIAGGSLGNRRRSS